MFIMKEYWQCWTLLIWEFDNYKFWLKLPLMWKVGSSLEKGSKPFWQVWKDCQGCVVWKGQRLFEDIDSHLDKGWTGWHGQGLLKIMSVGYERVSNIDKIQVLMDAGWGTWRYLGLQCNAMQLWGCNAMQCNIWYHSNKEEFQVLVRLKYGIGLEGTWRLLRLHRNAMQCDATSGVSMGPLDISIQFFTCTWAP